jgi:hypothetical protein
MQAVFDYLGNHGGNLRDLMAVWFWILPFQGMPALVASLRFDGIAVFDLLYRHQLPSRAFMAWLSPSLAFALGSLAWLWRSLRSVAGRRL